MKLRLHHIEMCVKDLKGVVDTFCDRFGMTKVGKRDTKLCEQAVVQMGRTAFLITSYRRKSKDSHPKDCKTESHETNSMGKNHRQKDVDEKNMETMEETQNPTVKSSAPFVASSEPWTIFCCAPETWADENEDAEEHVDSVFNIALEVVGLEQCVERLRGLGVEVLEGVRSGDDEKGRVKYAVVKSCVGNIVHTLIEKVNYSGWFLPGFEKLSSSSSGLSNQSTSNESVCENSYFDHVALVCRLGETDSIIRWYQDAFEMKRFITNREDSELDGLVIGDDVGLRLKVMEFWKCSDVGLSSHSSPGQEDSWEELKIVVAESLPYIKNTQVENFIRDHRGPGIQHIGLHTQDIVPLVKSLGARGVNFRQPPPTYYTEIGQLKAILSAGEDPALLSEYGILLDDEADPFEDEPEPNSRDVSNTTRYLMQIFTYPIFDRDTFFLEVIQRKNARGFGVGNVTALARSVNAYQKMMQKTREGTA